MDPSQLDIANQLNSTIESANAGVTRLGENLSTQTAVANDFFSAFDGAGESMNKMAGAGGSLSDQLMGVAESSGKAGKQLGFSGKVAEFAQKSYASLQIVVDRVASSLKVMYNFLTMSFVYDMLAENLDNVRQQAGSAHDANEQLVAQFGRLKNDQKVFRRFMNSASADMEKYGRSIGSVFGIEAGEVLKGFLGKVEELGVGATRFMKKMRGAEAEVILFNEALNVSTESAAKLAYKFEDPKQALREMAVGLVGGAQSLGVNIKEVGKNFDAAIKDVKNFGYMTNKELIATTLYATKLGMEMSELASFGEGFDSFESAAEKVGKLSAMFGIQLDTLDMVMADNPAEKMDMLNKALRDSGRNIQDILANPKEARYLADTLGMTNDQIQKLAASDMDNFGFSDAFKAAEDAKKSLTEKEALNVLAKEMKKLRNSMSSTQQKSKSFFGAFKEGFAKAAAKGGVFHKVTKAYMDTLGKFHSLGAKVYGLVSGLFMNPLNRIDPKTGKIIGTAPPAPLRGLVEPFLKYFKQMGDAVDKVKGVLSNDEGTGVFDVIKKILNGEEIPDDFNIFEMIIKPFEDVQKPTLLTPEIRKGLIKVVRLLGFAIADAFEYVGDAAVRWVEKLTAPKDVKKKMDEEEPTLMGTMGEVIGRILTAMWDTFGQLAYAGGGLMAWFKGGEFNGRTITREESLFGRMTKSLKSEPDAYVEPNMFGAIGEKIMVAFSNMLGLEGVEETLQVKGASFGNKFAFFVENVKLKFYDSMIGFGTAIRDFAQGEVARMDSMGGAAHGQTEVSANGLLGYFMSADFNLYYEIMKNLATSMSGAGGFEGTLQKLKAAATKKIQSLKSVIDAQGEAYKSVLGHAEDSLGTSMNLTRRITQLKENFGDSITYTDGDVERIIEINKTNLPKIMRILANRGYVYEEGAKDVVLQISAADKKIREAQENLFYVEDPEAQLRDQIAFENEVAKASGVLTQDNEKLDALNVQRTQILEDLRLTTLNGEDVMTGALIAELESVEQQALAAGATGGIGLAGSLQAGFMDGWDSDAFATVIDQKSRESMGFSSPSWIYMGLGEEAADSFLIGFFGDDPEYSIAGGKFSDKFDQKMMEISNDIAQASANMAREAAFSMDAHLGRAELSQILKGEAPLQVHVKNERLIITANMNVTMDSRDIAVAMAGAPGGSYFKVNDERSGSSEQYSTYENMWKYGDSEQ